MYIILYIDGVLQGSVVGALEDVKGVAAAAGGGGEARVSRVARQDTPSKYVVAN